MKSVRVYSLLLAAILVFSATIYFYHLGREGLYTDEYLSLFIAQQHPADILFNHKKATNPNTIPPLYEILLHYWLKLFGQGEFAQRSLSAFFGVLSVFFLYRLASFLFDIRTGVLSALFGSFSLTWFTLFRMDRCYGLFIFLALVSFYVFFRLMKKEPSGYLLFVLIAVNSLLLYTHYLSFLLILLELILSISQWEKNRRFFLRILMMCFAVGFAYLPWFNNLFYDFVREPVINYRFFPVRIDKAIFDTAKIIFADFHFQWFPALTILYIPFIIRGGLRLKRNTSEMLRELLPQMVLILAVPFVFIYFFMSIDRIRYYAPFMFPLFILLAYGIQDLNTKNLFKRLLIIAALVIIISNNVMDFIDFFNFTMNEEWKQAARFIRQVPDYHNKKNIFIFQTIYNPPVFSYYYWGPRVASRLVDNIATRTGYEEEISGLGITDKIYVMSDMKGKEFFRRLDELPDNAWIWLFRYHDLFFHSEFGIENQNRYFFHKVPLNKDVPAIDMYLLRRIRNS